MPEPTEEVQSVNETEEVKLKEEKATISISGQEKEKTITSLQSKLSETRERVSSHREKILSTMIQVDEHGYGVMCKKEDRESIAVRLEKEGVEQESINNPEALIASVRDLREEAREKSSQIYKRIREIKRKIEDLQYDSKNANGLFGFIKRRRIKRQVEKLGKKERKLMREGIPFVKKASSYGDYLDLLRDKGEAVVEEMLEQELLEIGQEYAQFANEVLGNEHLMADLQDAYLQQNIEKPLLASGYDPDKVSEFTTRLKEIASDENIPLNDRRRSLSGDFPNIYNIIGNEAINYIEGNREQYIEYIIAEMVVSDIQEIAEEIFTAKDTYNGRRIVRKMVRKSFQNLKYTDEYDPQFFELDEAVSYKAEMISILQGTDIASRVFSETINTVDEQVYQQLMKKSLRDLEGRYIDALKNYPTPEAVRNLLIIAGSEPKGYRVNHANRTLRALAQKEDWPDIIEKTINEFPQLSNARETLMEWEYGDYGNAPGIREAVGDLAMSIIQEEKDDRKLVELSYEALPLDNLFALLEKNEDIEIDWVSEVREWLARLEEIKGRYEDEELDGIPYREQTNEQKSISEINRGFWQVNQRVRKIIQKVEQAYYEGYAKGMVENVDKFHKLVKISKEINRNPDDIFLAEFLSSSEFWLLFKDAPEPKLDLLINSSEHCPALLGKKRQILVRILKPVGLDEITVEDLQFLNQAAENYDGGFLMRLCSSVLEGKLPKELALSLTDYCPALSGEKREEIIEVLIRADLGGLSVEDLSFLDQISQDYEGYFLIELGNQVFKGFLSKELALSFKEHCPALLGEKQNDLLLILKDVGFSEIGANDLVFLNKLTNNYENDLLINLGVSALNETISKEFALSFKDNVPLLMEDDFKQIASFVIRNGSAFGSSQELQLVNDLVGRHSKAADQLVRDYVKCLEAGVVDDKHREWILDFTDQFRVLSPALFERYIQAREGGVEDLFFSGLQTVAERLISSQPLSKEERASLYYPDLIRAVYPNNSENWTDYENNQSCEDRSKDLDKYELESRYEIDLLSAADIEVREGERLDEEAIERVKDQVLGVYRYMEGLGFDSDRAQAEIEEEVDQAIAEISETGELESLDLDNLDSIEEKMFLVLVDSIYGSQLLDSKRIKDLLTRYEFAYFQDIREYIEGTTDRTTSSKNPDYALLCELYNFYADRLKEVNRDLVEEGWNNPQIAELMPQYFESLTERRLLAEREDKLNRYQIDNLGLTDSFVQRLGRTLSKRSGREYSPEKVREIVRRYEGITGGLQEAMTTSPKGLTKAFYGQLRSEREKVFNIIREITGQEVDPSEVHLGEIDLEEMIAAEQSIAQAEYNKEQFASYTGQRFIDIFVEELDVLEEEIAKFEVQSDEKQEKRVVHAFITKTKESANARMTGGVCVSGDNPAKVGEECQWNMPNYFQLVLQDPETLRCQGLVLLHEYEGDNREKILNISLNPSSTYLYSVGDQELFDGMMGVLEGFAEDNGFDMITVPNNRSIRSNRMETGLERAIEERIAEVNRQYEFSETQRFSYEPSYFIKKMNLIWEIE